MPGAGSGNIAWSPESSYLGGTGDTPTYYNPGTNVTVQTAELSRNLLELLLPGDVEANDYLAQQFEGQLGVNFVMSNDDFHRLVFNSGNTGFESGIVNSAEWYLGVDHFSGTTERQIQGWVPASCNIQYNGATDAVNVTVQGPYGNEEKNTSLTPGSIENNSTGSEVPGHGASLQIASSRVTKLQSASINIDGISRLIRDSNSPYPVEAVVGNVTSQVEMSAVYDGSDLYERALGSISASSAEDFVDSVTGSMTFSHGSTQIASYDFDSVKPNTYDWQDLINNEADLNESITFNATGITASDPV